MLARFWPSSFPGQRGSLLSGTGSSITFLASCKRGDIAEAMGAISAPTVPSGLPWTRVPAGPPRAAGWDSALLVVGSAIECFAAKLLRAVHEVGTRAAGRTRSAQVDDGRTGCRIEH